MSTVASKTQIEALISELKKASSLYYSQQESFLTDAEFDAKYETVIKHKENYPELFIKGTEGYTLLEENSVTLGGNIESKSLTVTHEPPMLSQQKIKNVTDLEKFITKMFNSGATGFKLQAKLDGLAFSIKYINGQISQIATRGTGTVGENCNYLLNSSELTILHLPKVLPVKDDVELRGEIIFTKEQYEKANNERLKNEGTAFSNSRNAGAGIIKKAEKGIGYPVEMTFVTYSLLINGQYANLDTINTDSWKITTTDKVTQENTNLNLSNLQTVNEVMTALNAFHDFMNILPYATDGAVIKPCNEAEMMKKLGSNNHHPYSQAAWKYPTEQATSTVTDIITTVGKTGRLTPVALFDKTLIDGSYVSKASVHNFALLKEKDVRIGSTIIFEKANQIIPQIVTVIANPENSLPTPIPTKCPVCGTEIVTGENKKVSEINLDTDIDYNQIKTLQCPNLNCDAKNVNTIITAVKRSNLDIDGLGPRVIESLYEQGTLQTVADLYTLDEQTLADTQIGTDEQSKTFGIKRAKTVMQQIENSKNLPLDRLLASLGINQLGKRLAKILVTHFETLENIANTTVEQLAEIDKIGTVKAESIVTGLKQRAHIIEKMKANGVKFGQNITKETDNDTTIDLSDLSFSISGEVPQPFRNRNELVSYIENSGGTFNSTPNKNTSYMIADKSSTSSKVVKAKNLNISIISAQEFTDKFTNMKKDENQNSTSVETNELEAGNNGTLFDGIDL